MKRTMKNCLLGCSSLLIGSLVQAATISWGGVFGATNYAADGSALETGNGPVGITFELGIFTEVDGTVFTPTSANAADWEARWVPVRRNDGLDGPTTSTPGVSDYVPATGVFGGNVEIGDGDTQTDNSALSSGRQVYLWGYSEQSYLEGQASPPEWILLTGSSGGAAPSDTNWRVPETGARSQGATPLIWEVTTADTAVVGRISSDTGGGVFMAVIPPLGLEDIQFAAIPEPGSCLLVVFFGGFVLLRRRRV